MDLNGRETFQSIELGDSTISRRMCQMAEDIEEPLGQLNANHEIPSTARRNYFAIQTLCLMVKYANLMKAELSWLGFEEMEYQDGQKHFALSTG
ncbi:hypothetical protein M513_14211 [Trichuris suis]|uniref:Uncharacterized protein n=1 Tax=Trichuris suis TaxID=68888 RepID=A0A085LIW6_9BILA|nr:hypothetical protein M513_14211 [Trichuris suis]